MTLNNGPLLDDFWDGTAGGYDRWYSSPQGAMYDYLEKRAAAWALRGGRPPSAKTMAPPVMPAVTAVTAVDNDCQAKPGTRLVEVGCGTGRWAVWLAGQGYQVTGIDRSPGMLEVARTRQSGDSITQQTPIHWLEGDAGNLPVADGAFDVALSVATLDYLGDGPHGSGFAERAVSEMARSLRSGGRMVIGVFNRLAPLNIWRARDGGPPWDGARMFSPDELLTLLAPHGSNPGVRVTAWLPEDDRLLPVAAAADHQNWQNGRDDGLMLFGWVDVR